MARNITITFADGTTHTYQNAPDDVTPDAVQARAEKEFSRPVKGIDGGAKSPVSLASQIPGNVGANTALTPEAPPDSLIDKAKGVGEAALSLGTGMVGSTVGGIAGLYRGVTGGKYGTQAGVREAADTAHEVAGNLTYQPRTQTGQKLTQAAGDVINQSGIIGVAPLVGDMAALGRASVPAGRAIRDMASSGASQAGGKLSEIASNMVPKIAPNVADLAQKAQNYNIPLRPDMLIDNKFAKIIGDTLEKVPLSGSKASERQIAYNKAIIGTIGGDSAATKLTPDVFDAAMRKSGRAIGDISERTPVTVDSELSGALNSHLENAAKFETSDVQNIVANYVKELQNKAVDGVIPGDAFRKINSKLGAQMRNTSNGDLKHALGNLQEDMQNALQRYASPDDLPGLLDARKQYAIAKTIEPLVAKSANGDISPAGLMGRVTSNNSGKSRMARGNAGEIGDIARIGQQFLKEPGTSNTAERSAAYGILGGGLYSNPTAAAGIYSVANLYNRLGPRVANTMAPSGMRDLMTGGQ